VSQYQKSKTNLDLLEQEIVNGSGISWAICKSAPFPTQIIMPASHHSGRMPFLPLNQQHQSTEGKSRTSNLLAYLSASIFYNVCRYADFVVHEIDKDGEVVHLTDINPPKQTESWSDITEEVRSID